MAYIGATEVKAIREALKARFPEFKFGCRKGSGSLSVDVVIKSGPIDFIGDYTSKGISQDNAEYVRKSGYIQVNQYWMDSCYSGEALAMLEEVMKIIKTAPARGWYDNSDAMTDYFDTAFYIHLNIGEWNKPYTVV